MIAVEVRRKDGKRAVLRTTDDFRSFMQAMAKHYGVQVPKRSQDAVAFLKKRGYELNPAISMAERAELDRLRSAGHSRSGAYQILLHKRRAARPPTEEEKSAIKARIMQGVPPQTATRQVLFGQPRVSRKIRTAEEAGHNYLEDSKPVADGEVTRDEMREEIAKRAARTRAAMGSSVGLDTDDLFSLALERIVELEGFPQAQNIGWVFRYTEGYLRDQIRGHARRLGTEARAIERMLPARMGRVPVAPTEGEYVPTTPREVELEERAYRRAEEIDRELRAEYGTEEEPPEERPYVLGP